MLVLCEGLHAVVCVSVCVVPPAKLNCENVQTSGAAWCLELEQQFISLPGVF